MPNLLPPPRSALIIKMHDAMMAVLQEGERDSALRPDEGLIAVELLFKALFDNAMEHAPSQQLREVEQKRHMAAVTRISSRIAAWPAKPHERH